MSRAAQTQVGTQEPLTKIPRAPRVSRFLGTGCDKALFSGKTGFFRGKGGRALQWMRGLVRILQERQFSEEVWAIQWTAGLWKLKSCCPHPLPENQLWHRNKLALPPPAWKWNHLSFLVLFPLFYSDLSPIWGQSLWSGQLWSCWGFPLFCRHFGCFGVLERKTTICPFRPPNFKHQRFPEWS